MCYDEKDYTLNSFDGIKVSVKGALGDETYRIADVYIEDGSGIERLMKVVESERPEWDNFVYSVKAVRSIDDVVYDHSWDMRKHALVRVFMDEFEYQEIDASQRRERLQGIALVTGNWSHIGWEYAKLVSQVDESLLPEEDREFAKMHPPIIEEAQAEALRKGIERK